MNRNITTDALVIHVSPSGENDRMLTLLSAEHGQLSVLAKGARSLKNRYMPATVPYVYGNYELAPAKSGDLYILRDATPSEAFRAIGNDIVKTYLAQYIVDVACELSAPAVPAAELLSLTLNSLFAIASDKRDRDLVKAVFELRAAAMSGYEPDLECCRMCGNAVGELSYLDVMNGGLLCPECAGKAPKLPADAPKGAVPTDEFGTRSILMPLSPSALAAMKYAIEAPGPKMLSFGISSKTDKNYFCKAAETYLLSHLERGFPSHKQYKELTAAER